MAGEPKNSIALSRITHDASVLDGNMEEQLSVRELLNGHVSYSTRDSEATSIAKELDWDAPDDPENPYNWPLWQRIFHTAVPALYCFPMYVTNNPLSLFD